MSQFVLGSQEIAQFMHFFHDAAFKISELEVLKVAKKYGLDYSPLSKDTENLSELDQKVLIEALGGDKKKIDELESVLNQMIVCRCVDNFLTYLSGILFEIYISKPETLRSSEKIEISTVLSFENYEQLVHNIAERRVNELSYKGVEDIADDLLKTIGFNLFDTNDELNKVSRAVQIRNLITHNRSVVNKRALSKCSALGFEIDEAIILSPEDVKTTYELFNSIVSKIDGRAVSKFKLSSNNI